MANNKNHVINFDNIVNYVDPADIYTTNNGVHTIPTPEDYTIYVDLEMEVPRRSNTLISSEAAGRFILKWEIGDTSERTINSGSDFYRTKTKNSTIQYLSTDGTEYLYQDVKDGKKTGEMFGMENISVSYNAYFVPEITIKFTDIRGTSLFSPAQQRAEAQGYAVKANSHLDEVSLNRIANDIEGSFFQGLFAFPYPKMTLKIKGFYGDPIAYELTVAKVDSAFESSTGNYSVTVNMIGYAFSLLNDITMAALVAAPSDLYAGKAHWDEVIQKNDNYLLSDGVKMPRLSDLLTKLAQLSKEQEVLDQKEEKLKETNKTQIERTQALLDELDNFTKNLSGATTEGKTVGYRYKTTANFVIPSQGSLSSENKKNDFYNKVLLNDNNKKLLNRLNKAISTYYEKGTEIQGLPKGGFITDSTIVGETDIVTLYDTAITKVENATAATYSNTEFKSKISSFGDTSLSYTSSIPGTYDVYVVDPSSLKTRINSVLTNLKDNENTITNNIKSEQLERYRDVLGFTPSLYNVMAIVMAHFECMLAGFKYVEDQVKEEVGNQERNPESLGIYGSYYDVTANKQMFPFPQVTSVQTTGNLTRKSTTSWLGHYSGAANEPEVQWIEGLIRGILEFEEESVEAENISNAGSNETAGLVTSAFSTYTDLLNESYRNNKDKSPWGINIDFNSPENVAARIAVRAQQVMMRQEEKDFGDNSNPGYLAVLDAYNFFKMYDKDLNETTRKTLSDKDSLKKLICTDSKELWGGKTTPQTFLANNRGNRYGKCRIGNNDKLFTYTFDRAAIPLYGYDISGYYNETPGVWSFSSNSGHTYDCINFKILNDCGWFYSESSKYDYTGLINADNKLKLFKQSNLKGYFTGTDAIMKDCKKSTEAEAYKSWKEQYQQLGEAKADLNTVFHHAGNDVLGGDDYKDCIENDTNWTWLHLPGQRNINPFFVFQYYDESDINARAFIFLNSLCIDLVEIKTKSGLLPGTYAQFILTGAWLWAKDNNDKLANFSKVLYDKYYKEFNQDSKTLSTRFNQPENIFYKNLFVEWVNNKFGEIESNLALFDKKSGTLISGYQLHNSFKNKTKWSAEDVIKVIDQNKLETGYGTFSEKHKGEDESVNTGQGIVTTYKEAYVEWYAWAKNEIEITGANKNQKYKLTYFDNIKKKDGLLNDITIRITPTVSTNLDLYHFATDPYTLLDLSRINTSAMASMKESYFNSYIANFASTIKSLTEDLQLDDPVTKNEKGENVINATKQVDESFKIDLYNYLKKVYDKWLAGNNYVLTQKSKQSKLNKSWYDDYCYDNFFKKHFYFIDDLYNEVGDYILINFTTLLRELLAVIDTNVSLLQFITNLEAKHGVQFLSIQNFSNLADKDCLERAFKLVPIYDMRTVSPTPDFISIYSYKPSQAINIPGSDYDDDSVSMQTELMVKETVKPNKISVGENIHQLPCFGVPYGSQYQHFFTDIGINTSESMATMDSINATFSLANLWQNGNSDRKVYSMGQDLYTVYNNRSYTCTLTMLGSAWVQPLMYFELLNIPMFKGAYQIKKVTHEITQGKMITKIVGVRICRYIDNFVINANALALNESASNRKELAEGKKANVGNDCAYTRYDVITGKKSIELNHSRNIAALSSYNPDWINQGNAAGVNYANLWEMVLGTIKSIVTDNNNLYVTPGHNVNIQLVASLFYIQAYNSGWETFILNHPEICAHKGKKKIGTTDPDDSLIKQLVEEVFTKSPSKMFETAVSVSAGNYMKIVGNTTVGFHKIADFKTLYISNNTTNDTESGNEGYASTLSDDSLEAYVQSDCFVFYQNKAGLDVYAASVFPDDEAGSEDLNVTPEGTASEPKSLTDLEVLFVRALRKTLNNVEAFSGDIKVEKSGLYLYIRSTVDKAKYDTLIFDAIMTTYFNEVSSVFWSERAGVKAEGEENIRYTAIQVKISNGTSLSKSVGYNKLKDNSTNEYQTLSYTSNTNFPDEFKKTIVKVYFGGEATRENILKAKARASELPNYTPSGKGSEWSEEDIDKMIEHFKGIKIENCPPSSSLNCKVYRNPQEYINEAKARYEAEGKDTKLFTTNVGNKSLAMLFESDTAKTNKVSNEPVKDTIYDNAYDTLKQLAKILNLTPVTSGGTVHFSINNANITSCYRTDCVNEKVNGSSSNSMHMKGWAIDFQYNAGKKDSKGNAEYVYSRIVSYAQAYYNTHKVLLFDQLLCESRGNSHWIHFGNYSVGPNGQPRRRGEYFHMNNDKVEGDIKKIS